MKRNALKTTYLELLADDDASTHLVDGVLRVVHGVEVDECESATSVDNGVVDRAKTTEMLPEILLGYRGSDAVQPHAVGRHAFAKAQLDEENKESSVHRLNSSMTFF